MKSLARWIGLAVALLIGALGAHAGEDALRAKAEAFRSEMARHADPAWRGQFMEAFLGKNGDKAQPELHRLLTELSQASAGQGGGDPLKNYRGDKAVLAEVLDLAVREARIWSPGRVLSLGTADKLIALIAARPPPAGLQYRVESYPIPEELRGWLYEEQVVNDKLWRFQSDISNDGMNMEIDPTTRPVFWLSHIEIPIEEAKILDAGFVDPLVKDQLLIRRNGRTYVRYFIHPGSLGSPKMQSLIEKYGLKTEFLASPTSSPRSLVVWNPHTKGRFFLAKVSLTQEFGGIRRINAYDKGLRAVTTTRAMDQLYGLQQPDQMPRFMRESMVVFPEHSDFGMILREVPQNFPNTPTGRLVPVMSLTSARPDGREPLMVEMIRQSGLSPVEFLSQKFVGPFMKVYADVAFGLHMAGEPHQQNVLAEIGRDGQLTSKFVLRDLDSYKMDVESLLRKGWSLRGFFAKADTGLSANAKLTKARGYYDMSYYFYVRDNWGLMLSRTLAKYFPDVKEKDIYRIFDQAYAAEAERHLGIKSAKSADAKANRAYFENAGYFVERVSFPDMTMEQYRRKRDKFEIVHPEEAPKPNELMERYREMALELDPKLPQQDGLVSQKVLAEEYARLKFNFRTFTVKSTSQPPSRWEYVLHDGAIEARTTTGRVIGFAFLEPPGSGAEFYKSLPYPRQAPNPATLSQLYSAGEHLLAIKRERLAEVQREHRLRATDPTDPKLASVIARLEASGRSQFAKSLREGKAKVGLIYDGQFPARFGSVRNGVLYLDGNASVEKIAQQLARFSPKDSKSEAKAEQLRKDSSQSARGVQGAEVTEAVKSGAMGMGYFTGGYLLKSAAEGHGREAIVEMATNPGFAAGLAGFTGAQFVMNRVLPIRPKEGFLRGATRMNVPLYAVSGVMAAAAGESDPAKVALSTTSFAVAMGAMMPGQKVLHTGQIFGKQVSSQPVYRMLTAAGPRGKLAIAGLEMAQAATLLWTAERIDGGLQQVAGTK